MRLLIDCTYTANHTYVNTGIHRVVRQLTSELANLSQINPNIKIVPVKFNGNCIIKVTSLDEKSINKTEQFFALQETNQIARIFNKVLKKIKSFLRRVIRKSRKILFYFINVSPTLKNIDEFEGIKFSAADIYLIADANWNLPESYYIFLESLKKNGVTLAFICYDLIPIQFPELCDLPLGNAFSNFYNKYSHLFDKVLCISRKIAEDYLEAKKKQLFFNNNYKQSVDFFRLGCDFDTEDTFFSDNISCNPEIISILTQQYFLVVGSIVPHKNPKTVVAAFELLVKSNKNIHLVFLGNRGWHPETNLIIESNKMYGNLIHILESVNDAQLKLLYKNCYCLIQSSFYEGFGLPIVEALRYYKPVISSNAGSLPEVGGDFCLYFDPHQPIELYQALNKLVSSEAFYNEIVAKIKNEYKPFAWKQSAEQLLELCLKSSNLNL